MANESPEPATSLNDDVADALLAAAIEIVDQSGVAALTNRRLAEAAGTTTMAIYTRFGGKEGVANALFDYGFEVLGTSLATLSPTDDASENLVALCNRYRHFGLERPGLYSIMFERAIDLESGFSSAPAGRTFDALVNRVAAVTGRDAISPVSRSEAFGVWALCHGLVNLELNGTGAPQQSDTKAALFTDAISVHVAGLATRLMGTQDDEQEASNE